MGGTGLQLSLYEQLGYLVVGYVALLAIQLDVWLAHSNLSIINHFGTIPGLIIAYVVGNLVQAIANIFIEEKKNEFSKDEVERLNKAATFFGTSKDDLSLAFKLCQLFVLEKQGSGQVATFNAMYGMYRGWLVIAVSEMLVLTVLLAIGSPSPGFTMGCLIGFATSIVILKPRMNRFAHYFREKVTLSFMILQK